MTDTGGEDAALARLRNAKRELQADLAQTDLIASMFAARGRSHAFIPEYTVMEESPIRVRMDGNRNHHRAHVHIDYGKKLRMASYAIDTGKKLVGGSTPYDTKISAWIIKHQADLMHVWNGIRGNGYSDTVATRLADSGL